MRYTGTNELETLMTPASSPRNPWTGTPPCSEHTLGKDDVSQSRLVRRLELARIRPPRVSPTAGSHINIKQTTVSPMPPVSAAYLSTHAICVSGRLLAYLDDDSKPAEDALGLDNRPASPSQPYPIRFCSSGRVMVLRLAMAMRKTVGVYASCVPLTPFSCPGKSEPIASIRSLIDAPEHEWGQPRTSPERIILQGVTD